MMEVGDKVVCTWKDGNTHVGEILQVRPSTKRSKTIEASIENKSTEEEFDYYVHFLHFDKRLDNWYPSTNATKEGLSAHPESKPPDKVDDHEKGKVRNVRTVQLGRFEMDTWYFSPYKAPEGCCKLFICEFCLDYFPENRLLKDHMRSCTPLQPPGCEIYREKQISVFEVDGAKHKKFCSNLCLFSKLFLDHKVLYFDVEPFLFYVLCEVDNRGAHVVGYFSKEKCCPEGNNLACILTYPPHQKKGYGKFLISLSYELSKREGRAGAPEKPLSDLGALSYRSYWQRAVVDALKKEKGLLSVDDISNMTGIRHEDVLAAVHSVPFIKYWKGQYKISSNSQRSTQHKRFSKHIRLCNPKLLNWEPVPPLRFKRSRS
eukprot:TRINITY_DN656369_c0_g1_i1.p1 TRINITY_DN656369_c0_g1~~TRINITY_DN656369_c0_g1_i1.p1  ORF type:complete len:374 (+),score=54.98 TRINITY_DN656369_c0_g1_i1:90-1211(+)